MAHKGTDYTQPIIDEIRKGAIKADGSNNKFACNAAPMYPGGETK